MNGNHRCMADKQNVPIKVVLGPRKCGTTTLHGLLSQVRGLAVPSPLKEAHLFDHGTIANEELRGFCGDTWGDDTQGFIDVATHYFSQGDLWANIKGTEGFIEATVIVRDPVARAVSHCMHQMRTKNLWHLTFRDLVDRYPEIVTDSQYSVVLPQLKVCFGENSLRLIKFEQLAANPLAVVSDLCGDFDLVEPVGFGSLHETQMNRGLMPKFPRAYSALRKGAQVARTVLGDAAVERIKGSVMPIWPASEHSVIKSKILNEMKDHPKAQALVLERDYTDDLMVRF